MSRAHSSATPLGELVSGPLADARGSDTTIPAGIVLFVAGALSSAFVGSIEVLLAGRVLQGIGVAGPKTGRAGLLVDEHRRGHVPSPAPSFAGSRRG